MHRIVYPKIAQDEAKHGGASLDDARENATPGEQCEGAGDNPDATQGGSTPLPTATGASQARQF